MLPSLVIGLREGLEAALIVGIVAAFLRSRGRLDLLRWVWVGVAAAVVLCLAVGIGLHAASHNLPYRQQEALETVIALVAVAMVTYMVVWMRRHARDMKASLEGATGAAIERGSAWALVLMAFLAVLREGFETAVFLVAAFNESDDPRAAGTGALIGIAVACGLGYGIYRGGIRIDLARFFKVTGVVLVLVAGGLVVSALHTAHEAGWLDAGQRRVFDLTWLVEPGSIRSALLTGMLGLQPRPVVVELIGWLVYVIPVMTFVLWPAERPFPRRAALAAACAVALTGTVAAITLEVAEPDMPVATVAELPTSDGPLVVEVIERDDDRLTMRVGGDAAGGAADQLLVADAVDRATVAGRSSTEYVAEGEAVSAGTETLTVADVAGLNGGRLPLGVDPAAESVTVDTQVSESVTVWIDDASGVVLDVSLDEQTTRTGDADGRVFPVGAPEQRSVSTLDGSADQRATLAAVASTRLQRIDTFDSWELGLAVTAGVAAIAGTALWLWGRLGRSGRPPSPRSVTAPQPV